MLSDDAYAAACYAISRAKARALHLEEVKARERSKYGWRYPAMFTMVYPALCEVARAHGYAAGLHGSMARDLDIMCVAWTEDAAEPQVLVDAVIARFQLLELYLDTNPTVKPHGRLAWALHFEGQTYLDLSVIPPKR